MSKRITPFYILWTNTYISKGGVFFARKSIFDHVLVYNHCTHLSKSLNIYIVLASMALLSALDGLGDVDDLKRVLILNLLIRIALVFCVTYR